MAGKAVLVIDMPNGCDECPLNSHTEYDFDVCWVTQGKGGCPLRPLPLKEKIKNKDEFMEMYGWMREVTTGMDVGWNDCIDEITGETE